MFIVFTDCAEDLLIPTECGKELRGDLVFCFKIIGKGVRVANAWHLKTRFISFGPELKMMPGEGEILGENNFPIVTDATAGRQRKGGVSGEIRTSTGGKTKVPHFVRSKANSAAERGVFEPSFC